MPPVLASDVLGSARAVLLDPAPGVTWSEPQLLQWLNDALAAAVTLKRDIAPATQALQLQPGAQQGLPLGIAAILEPYYMQASLKSVTKGNQALISRRIPNWRTATAVADITDIFIDERAPIIYHCYPPSDGSGKLVALCAMIPVVTTDADPIVVPDHYRAALVDAVVSRAYGANTRRMDIAKGTSFWQRFEAAIIGAKTAQKEVVPEQMGEPAQS